MRMRVGSRSLALATLVALLSFVHGVARAQPGLGTPDLTYTPPAEELEVEETELAPAQVARETEGARVVRQDVDLELLQGGSRAQRLDERRRRLMWFGLFQGGFVVALLPYAIRTINRSQDPVIDTVTISWIALGSTIVNVTTIIGAHATLLESRMYRCNREHTPRRNGRTALALGAIPGLALLSPLFAHRQHQVNERARLCELQETMRAHPLRIVPADAE